MKDWFAFPSKPLLCKIMVEIEPTFWKTWVELGLPVLPQYKHATFTMITYILIGIIILFYTILHNALCPSVCLTHLQNATCLPADAIVNSGQPSYTGGSELSLQQTKRRRQRTHSYMFCVNVLVLRCVCSPNCWCNARCV